MEFIPIKFIILFKFRTNNGGEPQEDLFYFHESKKMNFFICGQIFHQNALTPPISLGFTNHFLRFDNLVLLLNISPPPLPLAFLREAFMPLLSLPTSNLLTVPVVVRNKLTRNEWSMAHLLLMDTGAATVNECVRRNMTKGNDNECSFKRKPEVVRVTEFIYSQIHRKGRISEANYEFVLDFVKLVLVTCEQVMQLILYNLPFTYANLLFSCHSVSSICLFTFIHEKVCMKILEYSVLVLKILIWKCCLLLKFLKRVHSPNFLAHRIHDGIFNGPHVSFSPHLLFYKIFYRNVSHDSPTLDLNETNQFLVVSKDYNNNIFSTVILASDYFLNCLNIRSNIGLSQISMVKERKVFMSDFVHCNGHTRNHDNTYLGTFKNYEGLRFRFPSISDYLYSLLYSKLYTHLVDRKPCTKEHAGFLCVTVNSKILHKELLNFSEIAVFQQSALYRSKCTSVCTTSLATIIFEAMTYSKWLCIIYTINSIQRNFKMLKRRLLRWHLGTCGFSEVMIFLNQNLLLLK
ncbi:hypothetical protein EGR_06036 [Echinococcus granulosus]|uniref:Uncharacterized protein n=1 Tax=Echinococcus granulosus TaxID=6210 RepID=W6UZH3_ECHGR|nr:hypothetical protein EGR_06036 [Echinococcus granulosus]EUB59044.1 hypothetical protein EGR_06036 [Echinococcus granulosus]